MADVKETLLTAEGLKKLEDELAYYKSVRRIEVSQRIKTAIEYGDISENSEYDDAKNEQAFIEGYISELENKINTAKIIDIILKFIPELNIKNPKSCESKYPPNAPKIDAISVKMQIS